MFVFSSSLCTRGNVQERNCFSLTYGSSIYNLSMVHPCITYLWSICVLCIYGPSMYYLSMVHLCPINVYLFIIYLCMVYLFVFIYGTSLYYLSTMVHLCITYKWFICVLLIYGPTMSYLSIVHLSITNQWSKLTLWAFLGISAFVGYLATVTWDNRNN